MSVQETMSEDRRLNTELEVIIEAIIMNGLLLIS